MTKKILIDGISYIREREIIQLQHQIKTIQSIVTMAEEWTRDQLLPESDIMMSALKDVRRVVRLQSFLPKNCSTCVRDEQRCFVRDNCQLNQYSYWTIRPSLKGEDNEK